MASPSSFQVFPFQGKAPDIGAHPRLFLLGLNSFDHQGPTSARPEYFMKPLLSPLPRLSLCLFPLTRHGSLFPHWAPACPSLTLIPPLHCHHSDLRHPWLLLSLLTMLLPTQSVCPLLPCGMPHGSFLTQHAHLSPRQWMSSTSDSSVNTLHFFLSTGDFWLIFWGSVQVSLWLPGSSGGAEKPSSFPSPILQHLSHFTKWIFMCIWIPHQV